MEAVMTDKMYRKPALSADELTLSLIATGIIQQSEKIARGEGMRYPYPTALQRGLDRLTAARLMNGLNPPQGIMDLLKWSQAPLADWRLDLPPEAIGEDDRLLHDVTPTDLCDNWACSGSNVEDDLTEQQFMKGVFDTCRAANSPVTYTEFRQALIEPSNRTLTKLESVKLGLRFASDGLQSHVTEAYSSAPASARFGSEYLCCKRCGNLLLPNQRGEPQCENERCCAKGCEVGRRIPLSGEPVWLKRPLRRYVADPGLAELDLKRKLEKRGYTVQLWPQYDKYDLRVTAQDGRVWLVDVKDWANPFLLARQVKEIETETPSERAYYVFPDERNREWPDYSQAFNQYCPRGCTGVMMRNFLKGIEEGVL